MTRRLVLVPLLAMTPLAVALTVGTATAQDTNVPEPDRFTSAFRVALTPDAVVDAMGAPTPGEAGATGSYELRLNSDEEVVCYDIEVAGVTGPFMSPARTATHVHEGADGVSGPARIVFPNPQGGSVSGCLQVPVVAGVPATGPDAGAGFSLKQIEANPTDFYADLHTAMRTAGVLRGQFGSAVPVGGVATGAGGAAGPSSTTVLGLVVVAGAALAGTAVAVRRRGAGSAGTGASA